MLGMDGYEVAVEMRRNAALSAARIVELTAWVDSASCSRAVARGLNSHLVKPAVIENLLTEATVARFPN